MLFIVEAQAADGFDVFAGKRRKKEAYVLIGIRELENMTALGETPTAICSVTSCFPNKSPLITRACFVLPMSLTPSN